MSVQEFSEATDILINGIYWVCVGIIVGVGIYIVVSILRNKE